MPPTKRKRVAKLQKPPGKGKVASFAIGESHGVLLADLVDYFQCSSSEAIRKAIEIAHNTLIKKP